MDFGWQFTFFLLSLAAFVLVILIGIVLLIAAGIGTAISKDGGKAVRGTLSWFLKVLMLTFAVFLCSLAFLILA